MTYLPTLYKGLGQLEAYIGAPEGVTFEMTGNLFWDSLGSDSQRKVSGVSMKRHSSKFQVIRLPSGKVKLQNWVDLFLAPVKKETNPEEFPIEPVQNKEDPSLEYDVFFKGDMVFFQACNGLFVSRIFGQADGLEAAKFFPDNTCCFWPSIGDLTPPTFEILNVISKDPSVSSRRKLLKRETYVNKSEEPVQRNFIMTWETQTTDKIFWKRLWGLGVHSSCRITVWQAKSDVVYSEHNQYIVSVTRQISEQQTAEVRVGPKTSVTAELYVRSHNRAVVPFTAVVQKKKPNGVIEILHERGAWRGLVYHDFNVRIKSEGPNEPHAAM